MQSLEAEIMAVDSIHVHVLCPFCGKIHRHGSFGDPTLNDYGSHVPHCSWPDSHPDEEYQLVVTPKTIRKDGSITAKDLKPWKSRQKQIRQALLAKKQAASNAHILAAVKSLKRDDRDISLWRVALHANEPQAAVRRWMSTNGLKYIRGRGWLIGDLSKADAEVRRLFEVVARWAETVHCLCCGQIKPGYGAEYYSGDVCRCADCRKNGVKIPLLDPGNFEGVIGVDIEQYRGQLNRRRS